jgi:hypothetical protein
MSCSEAIETEIAVHKQEMMLACTTSIDGKVAFSTSMMDQAHAIHNAMNTEETEDDAAEDDQDTASETPIHAADLIYTKFAAPRSTIMMLEIAKEIALDLKARMKDHVYSFTEDLQPKLSIAWGIGDGDDTHGRKRKLAEALDECTPEAKRVRREEEQKLVMLKDLQ